MKILFNSLWQKQEKQLSMPNRIGIEFVISKNHYYGTLTDLLLDAKVLLCLKIFIIGEKIPIKNNS